MRVCLFDSSRGQPLCFSLWSFLNNLYSSAFSFRNFPKTDLNDFEYIYGHIYTISCDIKMIFPEILIINNIINRPRYNIMKTLPLEVPIFITLINHETLFREVNSSRKSTENKIKRIVSLALTSKRGLDWMIVGKSATDVLAFAFVRETTKSKSPPTSWAFRSLRRTVIRYDARVWN